MGKGKRAQQKSRQEQRRRQRRITLGLIAVGGVLLLAGIVYLIWASSDIGPADSSEWEIIPTQPGVHIESGDPYDPWNSDPPTSGYHYGSPMQPAKAGFFDTALPDENMVHSLEHGYVLLWYDCSQVSDCDALKQNLKDVITATGTYKTVAMPRKNSPAPIVATSWGRMYKLQAFDKDKLVAFIKANRENSPEPNAP